MTRLLFLLTITAWPVPICECRRTGGSNTTVLRADTMIDDCTPEMGKGNGGAYELINLAFGKVYAVMKGTDGVYSQEEFDAWTPGRGFMKNTAGVRVTTFSGSCMYASPGRTGKHFSKIATYPEKKYKDLEYVELADICPSKHGMGYCGPENCVNQVPVIGSLKMMFIAKCHKMVWSAGTEVTVLTDPKGGKYIQHAWDYARGGSTARAELYPADWTMTKETLQEDLVIRPLPAESTGELGKKAFGDYPCGYVLLNDAEGNGFHLYDDAGYIPSDTWHLQMRGFCPSNLVRNTPLRFLSRFVFA